MGRSSEIETKQAVEGHVRSLPQAIPESLQHGGETFGRTVMVTVKRRDREKRERHTFHCSVLFLLFTLGNIVIQALFIVEINRGSISVGWMIFDEAQYYVAN